MSKVTSFLRWVFSDFFYPTVAAFICLYIWWFRLNPVVSGPGEQAAPPLIFGFILLLIYVFSIAILKLLHRYRFIKALFFAIAIFFLVINAVFAFFYLPRLRASAHIGKTTYYITSNTPFLECCGYHQFTEWQGLFRYDSSFFGYRVPELRFIYDQRMNEVNLVDVSGDSEQLYMSIGKHRRFYEGYAKLGNHLYYISSKCNRNDKKYCETFTYVLYQCELDHTLCGRLPIEYTGDDDYVNLKANETTGDIEFYLESYFSDAKELIFTYGEHSHCFVEGCSILEK